MANEFKHGSVGTSLSQTEWEAIGTHVVANQAVGDIIYADTTSQLLRLGIGSTNDVLRVSSGKPSWSATLAGLTLTTPTISSTGFANATHAHAASNSGGTLTTLGTIATGVWQGTDVGVAYGGTGVSTLTQNGVLVGNGASAIGSIDMSTKGHVLIGDGSGNPQMLAIGTDTHVLTADDGETTGVKWAAPAAAAAGSLTGSTLASGVVTTSATTVGVLNAGSITSGFGTINNGSSTITTTGAITGGSLVADNVTIDGNTISTDGDLLIALAGSSPTPDTDRVHIWEGSAGVVDSNGVTQLTIEHSDDAGIQFLTPADKVNYILFGDAAANNAGFINYTHSSDIMGLKAPGGVDFINTTLLNVGRSGDGWTSDTLTMIGSGTFAFVIAQNSDNALEIKDSAGTLLQVETRPGLTNARFWDFIAPANTVGATGRNDINQHLMRLKAYTCTMADTTTVTGAWEGMMLELGVPTIAHSGSGTRTVTTASSFHIEAIVAGTDITVTNNRMISTSVADCYLTAAGVWTDTSSTAKVKDNIVDLPLQDVGDLISQIRPRTYRYNDRIGDDHGRTRYGAVAEEFPDFLRVPGDASNSAVNSTVLANFALVASVYLEDKYEQLNERLEAIGA